MVHGSLQYAMRGRTASAALGGAHLDNARLRVESRRGEGRSGAAEEAIGVSEAWDDDGLAVRCTRRFNGRPACAPEARVPQRKGVVHRQGPRGRVDGKDVPACGEGSRASRQRPPSRTENADHPPTQFGSDWPEQ